MISGPVVADRIMIKYSPTIDPCAYYINDTSGFGAIHVTGSDIVIY